MYSIEFLEEAKEDYKGLDGSQRKLVDKSLKRIKERGMEAGEALHGDLAGCRKLKHKKAGLRVIFRQSAKGLEVVQIIAIGKRSDSEVYNTANTRI